MNILNATRSLGASIAAGLAVTASLVPAADAQTWIRDVDETNLEPTGLAVRDDGLVAITRTNGSMGGVTLFDAAGKPVGSYDLAAFGGGKIRLQDAHFLDDGTLAVCGHINEYPWIAAVEPLTGLPVWDTVLTRNNDFGEMEEMLVNDLGHLVAHGSVVTSAGFSSLVAAVRPELGGATVYRREFGDRISSLEQSSSGDLLMTSTELNVTVTRTSSFANIEWQKTIKGVGISYASTLIETSSGELMQIHQGYVDGLIFDFVVTKMTANGDLLWTRRHATFPSDVIGNSQRVAGAVATDDGGLVAAISQPVAGNGTRDAALLRLDADGNVVWLRPFGKPGVKDSALALEQTPDGGFVVLVEVDGGGFRVARLDANGAAGSCSIAPMSAFEVSAPQPTFVTETFNYTNYGGLWGDAAYSPFLHTLSTTYVCGADCTVTGATYGAGTVGSGGLSPKLNATDGSCLGYTPHLEISDAIGGASGLVFVGFAAGNTPALGGTFLIDPTNFLLFPIAVGGSSGVVGAGVASFPMGTDLMPFAGVTLHLQALFGDPNGPANKTLTNGVTFTIQ